MVLDSIYADTEIEVIPIRLGGMCDYAIGLDGNNTAIAAPNDVLTFLMDYQNTNRFKIRISHRPVIFVFCDVSKI